MLRCTYCGRELPKSARANTCAEAFPYHLRGQDGPGSDTGNLLRRLECLEAGRERKTAAPPPTPTP